MINLLVQAFSFVSYFNLIIIEKKINKQYERPYKDFMMSNQIDGGSPDDSQVVLLLMIEYFILSDIDECVEGLHNCSIDAFCNNTNGSNNCTCKPGFVGNGRDCEGSVLSITT